MFRFLRHRSPNSDPSDSQPSRNRSRRRVKRLALALLFLGAVSLSGAGLLPMLMKAQANDEVPHLITRAFDLPRTASDPLLFRPSLAQSITLTEAARGSIATAPRVLAAAPAASPTAAPASPPSADPPVNPGTTGTTGTTETTETTETTDPAATTVTPTPTEDNGVAPSRPTGATGTTETTETTGTTGTTTARQPTFQHRWEFNRSPDTGNRLRLQGVYPETRVQFTRPRNWQIRGAKVRLRFQHSPSLAPARSNITVRVNDTSVGSVPLSSAQGQVSEMIFNIPPNLLQKENDLAILAEQHTTEACSNPADPTLWTEILPDSQVLLDFVPQQAFLDFSRYPFPFLDGYSLENNALTYLRPGTLTAEWLTAAARFQADAARRLGDKPLDTKLVTALSGLDSGDRLIVIGTPSEQPVLSQLDLPFTIQNGKFLDGKRVALPDDVGLLMLVTTKDSRVPTLVATGNSSVGVLKAVQFLVQSKDSELAAGRALTITNLTEVPFAEPRNWQGFLPIDNDFNLSALTTTGGKVYQDVTVRGTSAPPVHINFRALPDDRFMPGSSMTLRYSHSPQVNSRLSMVEVRIDNVTIASKRLNSGGGDRETFTFRIPEDRVTITPQSQLDVHFVMKPEQGAACGVEADQQLWATLHSDTGFNLKRDNVVTVPNLKLLEVGYPFTEPQDLSTTAIALPTDPKEVEVATLMNFSKHLGRNSQANSVRLNVFLGGVSDDVRKRQNLVGIGTRDRLVFPEVFQQQRGGFSLTSSLTRQWEQSQVQPLKDNQGVIKAIVSPWNQDRQVMVLTGAGEQGLQELQTLLDNKPLLTQIQGDTVLVNSNGPDPNPNNPEDYTVKTFQETEQRRIAKTDTLGQIVLFLQDNWYMVPVGIAFVALPLYGFSQLYLNRVDR